MLSGSGARIDSAFMDDPELERTAGLAMAIVFAVLAAGVLLYLGWFAYADWRAEAEFRTPAAQVYARRACAALGGCDRLTISSGYDWQSGERHVLYSIVVSLHGGFREERARSALVALARGEGDTWLGWALRAKPAFHTSYAQPPAASGRSSAKRTHRGRR